MAVIPSSSVKADEKYHFVLNIFHILIIASSIILVVMDSVEILHLLPGFTMHDYLQVQLWVCVVFMLDFFIGLYLSNTRWHYIRKHFVFLLVSVPYLNIIYFEQLTLSPEVYYLLKFMPLVRGGYALVIVISWLTHNKITNLMVSYLTMLLSVVYFSSLIFYVKELPVNTEVTTYTDALWWAFMDVTTVGSNIYAVTLTGKALSVLLAALGMMMFPIFTVYITDRFSKFIGNKGAADQS
ncbi:MAG: potassium channel family protein [Bacteroidales bacterium]|nr:potassium channel family protein [Bacteroidales bacterium]